MKPRAKNARGGVDRTKSIPAARGFWQKVGKYVGPGVITGAADDDPSGIATYSIAGAQTGTTMLWTALLTWPLMSAVQMMCARLGMVTGRGMMGSLKAKFPKPLVVAAAVALFAANTINVGADLAGMGDAAASLTGLPRFIFVVAFGVVTAWMTIFCRYARIVNVLKWLVLSLFGYIVTAFLSKPDWKSVVSDTFIPHWPSSHDEWATLVAILGTTISPYLFVWQAAQEVEEDKAKGRTTVSQRRGATKAELGERRVDVMIGGFVSNAVMFFIILTCATTLHRNGQLGIETSQQAADALRPLAGRFATALYTLGIIGVGLLAIPTLIGSCAYALAESFHWREGLDEPFTRAKRFYGVVALSALIGIALNFARISPVKALYWSAVINGLLAPILLIGLLWVAADRTLMAHQPSSRASQTVVACAILIMIGAGIGLFVA